MQMRPGRLRLASLFSLLLVLGTAFGLRTEDDKFRQLEEILPTPNSYRTASGAPGHHQFRRISAGGLARPEIRHDDLAVGLLAPRPEELRRAHAGPQTIPRRR